MTSRVIVVLPTVRVSTAPTIPPASPIAPELEDEKTEAESKADAKKGEGEHGEGKEAKEGSSDEKARAAKTPVKPTKVDLEGIQTRIVALPLPASVYEALAAGLKGSVYFVERPVSGQVGDRGGSLSRWTPEDRKTEKLAEHVVGFELSANGEKMLSVVDLAKGY